jgi:hypothetical protein
MFPIQTNRSRTMMPDFGEPHGDFQAALRIFSVEPCLSGAEGGPGAVGDLREKVPVPRNP